MKLFDIPVFHSSAVVAFVVAALINVWVAVGHPLAKAPTANLDTGEVAQAIAAFKRENSSPSVVLLGSSLVLAPVMQAEANYLNQPVPRMKHRRMLAMEEMLSSSRTAYMPPGPPAPNAPRVFCLAMGGEMVSDAFLIAREALQGKNKPDAIIFGIAPRDVQDNCLPGIASTETFRVLGEPSDTLAVLRAQPQPFEAAADLLLQQASGLWKYHADVRTYALLRTKKMMEATMPWVVFNKYGETLELKPRRHGQFPEEVKGTPMIFPQMAMNHATTQATRFEYIRRYNPINEQLVSEQFGYLNQLLALCKDRGIRILVVNMPLSKDNLALIPPGFYDRYMSQLTDACQKQNVELLNMCDARYSDNTLFADGVHLDSQASKPFLSALSQHFATSSVAQSLRKTL